MRKLTNALMTAAALLVLSAGAQAQVTFSSPTFSTPSFSPPTFSTPTFTNAVVATPQSSSALRFSTINFTLPTVTNPVLNNPNFTQTVFQPPAMSGTGRRGIGTNTPAQAQPASPTSVAARSARDRFTQGVNDLASKH